MGNQRFTSDRARVAFWVAVLAVAFALRVGFGITRDHWPVSSDEAHWEGLALLIENVGVLSPSVGTYRPPLYPIVMAAIYGTFGEREILVRFFQAVLGTATVALIGAVGGRLGGRAVGRVSAAGAAVYPLFVFFSGVLMAETLLVFLTTASLLLALRVRDRPSTLGACGLGAVLGLAALCKPVVLGWAPLLLAYLGWSLWSRASRSLVVNVLGATVCAGLVALMPWSMRNRVVTGETVLVSANLGMNLMIGHEPGANGGYREGRDYEAMFEAIGAGQPSKIAQDRVVARTALGWMLDAPGRTLYLAWRKLVRFWSPLVPDVSRRLNAVALFSAGPLILLGLWGLFRGGGDREVTWAIATLAVSLSLIHMAVFAHTRFRLPVDALLFPPAAERGIVVARAVAAAVKKRWHELADGV